MRRGSLPEHPSRSVTALLAARRHRRGLAGAAQPAGEPGHGAGRRLERGLPVRATAVLCAAARGPGEAALGLLRLVTAVLHLGAAAGVCGAAGGSHGGVGRASSRASGESGQEGQHSPDSANLNEHGSHPLCPTWWNGGQDCRAARFRQAGESWEGKRTQTASWRSEAWSGSGPAEANDRMRVG